MNPVSPKMNLRQEWCLDPQVSYLNHGSYGACPQPVLCHQQELQRLMEKEPIQFFGKIFPELLALAKASLGKWIGASPDRFVFVPNATTGVNTVLRSLSFEKNDEIVVTNHGYNACLNAVRFIAERYGARVRTANVPFPIESPRVVLNAILNKLTPRTRLVMIDHVTSPTALIFPLEEIVREVTRQGIEILVDGAHAPGMIPLNLDRLAPTYYSGNLHKWLCAPKGSGFLYVHPDRQADIHPLSISHGFNSKRTEQSRFLLEGDWTGTHDPSSYLVIPYLLDYLHSLHPNGISGIMSANHAMTIKAREILCEALRQPPPCPSVMLGSMASVVLPNAKSPPLPPLFTDVLQEELLSGYRIEVPIMMFPEFPQRILRVSCQQYNDLAEYEALAKILNSAFPSQ